MRQGLAAWMQAWPVEYAPLPAPRSEPGKAIGSFQLTDDVQRQLTGELVNIILHQQDPYEQEIAL
jgi:hypothetical protein